MNRRVAITGASGFLGGALARRLVAAGAEVHALSRRPPSVPGVAWHAYELGGTLPDPDFFAGLDVVVHAAFGMDGAGPALEQRNLEAARQLHAGSRRQSCRFIFVSSMSAHAAAESFYGRAKWAIEQLLDPAVDTIVRPGLIVGPGGLYARMLATLRRVPVVPIFYGGTQPIQPIGVDDLTGALSRIIEQSMAGTFNLGAVQPITVKELYGRMLAAAYLRRPLLPFPGNLTAGFLRTAERLGWSLPLTSENLLGQKQLRAFPAADSFARLGFHPAPLDRLAWASPASSA